MAKRNYTEADHEQDSIRMMEHINSNKAEQQAAEENRSYRQQEEREKVRLTTLGEYIFRCVADVLIFVALYVAMKAGLIASVLVIPASYICAIRFGWCCNKVAYLSKKGRGSK